MKALLTSVAVLVVAVACFAQCPVAAFNFDEGEGRFALDSSPNAQVARITDASWVPGRGGTALSFAAGDAAVRVGRRRWLNLDQAITLEAWILPGGPSDSSRIIIAKNDEYLLRIDKQPEGGRISFFVQVGKPAVNWEPRVSSKEPPEPGKWTHVVVTWDGAMLRMYLNGKLESERARAGFPNPNPYPVMIGNFEYPSCHGGNFGGVIDEVRIYDQALTQDEVTFRYLSSDLATTEVEGPK